MGGPGAAAATTVSATASAGAACSTGTAAVRAAMSGTERPRGPVAQPRQTPRAAGASAAAPAAATVVTAAVAPQNSPRSEEWAGGESWVHGHQGRPPEHRGHGRLLVEHEPPPVDPHVDFFRDTPVRYLGFFNELGESFRFFIPRSAYIGTYAVAAAYCCADATAKGVAVSDAGGSAVDVADTAAEALVWQGLASVALPGLVINRIVAGWTRVATRLAPAMPRLASRLPPKVQAVAAGLAAIPLIIQPIDRAVDAAIEHMYRPAADTMLRGSEGP